MRLEEMTLKQAKEYCEKTKCVDCKLEDICAGAYTIPMDWDLEGASVGSTVTLKDGVCVVGGQEGCST